MNARCLRPQPRPAPAANLIRNSRRSDFLFDSCMWQVEGHVSQEMRWGSDGASLENVSAFSHDPILYLGGDLNLYRYVSNKPLDRTDPTGRFWFFGAGFVIGFGGALWWLTGLPPAHTTLTPAEQTTLAGISGNYD